MKTAKTKSRSALIPAGMPSDDLERYISRRKARDSRLARTFEEGYQVFFIGARLQAEREKAGVTQSELARRIGTTKTAISRLENGGRDIRLSTVERIAHALGRVVSIELKAA
ncbi:MAG: helix-turn-helix domain-containing protein [Methylacidiphilales bacterium]|nr:helix-turn-helix domain-containing protein [Candidatus Methylacidiphilales bacterium]